MYRVFIKEERLKRVNHSEMLVTKSPLKNLHFLTNLEEKKTKQNTPPHPLLLKKP